MLLLSSSWEGLSNSKVDCRSLSASALIATLRDPPNELHIELFLACPGSAVEGLLIWEAPLLTRVNEFILLFPTVSALLSPGRADESCGSILKGPGAILFIRFKMLSPTPPLTFGGDFLPRLSRSSSIDFFLSEDAFRDALWALEVGKGGNAQSCGNV